MTRASLISLVAFLLVVVVGGLVVGYLTAPGAWYAQLAKPSFNPPSWVFGPVWTVLYVMIAVAGWRIWRRKGARLAMTLWAAQQMKNFLCWPVFFAAHRVDLALVVILVLLAVVVAFTAVVWRRDRVSAGLFVPYGLWVAFASTLNASIYALNA
ncbi:MAG: TspO/MBR family protein [Bauldia litoralis]